jgi:hypothetical protein
MPFAEMTYGSADTVVLVRGILVPVIARNQAVGLSPSF